MLPPRACFLLIFYLLLPLSATAATVDKPHITLPPTLYAVPGVPVHIDYRNAVLGDSEEKYAFQVKCNLGKEDVKLRWTAIANDGDVGEHLLEIELRDSNGKLLDETSTILKVVPRDSGKDRKITLLMVGDSLTAATSYCVEVGRLLSLPNNPAWTMIGTARIRPRSPGVAHEGYGGWTWKSFNTRWGPEEWTMRDNKQRRARSPFLFDEGTGTKLDIQRYVRERADGNAPDFVTFLLGINDCFHADPTDEAAVDKTIESMIFQAEILLAAFRDALPDTDLGICLTPPPNDRESAFYANYKGNYTRKGWRSIQYRLVERQLKAFGGREKEHIFIVPTSLDLDPVAGYPENNGVHPNKLGYQRIGTGIYSWLKWRLAEK